MADVQERWIRGWLAPALVLPEKVTRCRKSKMPREPTLQDHLIVLRLEVAKIEPNTHRPVWALLDFVRDDQADGVMGEVKRVFERFSRIVASLKRQAGGHVARNEPYRGVLGVRCRMRDRVLGVWPPGPHDAALTTAPLTPASLNSVEQDFESWRARALQKSRVASRKQSEPPPCRANRSDSNAKSEE
jgi:hypothetical protein